MKTATEA